MTWISTSLTSSPMPSGLFASSFQGIVNEILSGLLAYALSTGFLVNSGSVVWI